MHVQLSAGLLGTEVGSTEGRSGLERDLNVICIQMLRELNTMGVEKPTQKEKWASGRAPGDTDILGTSGGKRGTFHCPKHTVLVNLT